MAGPLLPCIALLIVLPAAKPQASGTVIRLTVSPAPAPKPALRYQLLPELEEMTPGNPIASYLRCLLDQDFNADQEMLGPSALKAADRAARMDRPDWQVLEKLRQDGINLLLPDVQKLRGLGTALAARMRDEIALRRFDDALVTAKTIFALSRHMGEHPTLIADLVGTAIAQSGIAALDEMIEQPGCPNLYWALTHLPAPLVSLEKGMQGERVFIGVELRDLTDREPMTSEQLKKAIARIDYLRDQGSIKVKTRDWLDARKKDEKLVAAARARLLEYGIPEEKLAKFPAEQILLLDELRQYEIRRDESMKFVGLPTWEAVPRIDAVPAPKKDESLFNFLLPSLEKVRRIQGRLEQRIALLRHVEALRMYAAEHEGKLPAKLADVGVPLPLDPFSGKPFGYSVEGDTASVIGTAPAAEKDNSAYLLRYEITIRK